MARKAVGNQGKQEEIIAAARACFFEKGYDGTTIRSIMKRAGAEVGLFYYYFDSKDAIFDQVLDSFFAGYQIQFAKIVRRTYRDPYRGMTSFFDYMRKETEAFRRRYGNQMHWTVRMAIRERTLTIIAPYIRETLDFLVTLGAKPPMNLEVASILLAHGIGSTLLHEDSDWAKTNGADIRKASNLIMGLDPERGNIMLPDWATQQDAAAITALAACQKQYFPGFDEKEFADQIERRIELQVQPEILVIRHKGQAVGCIAFSREQREIEFLAVSPQWKRQGIGDRLLVTAISEFEVGTLLSVVTYREEDEHGTAARTLYQKVGFEPGELLEVCGYPCQKLILNVPDGVPGIMKNV
ncbi:MAG: GNAT family N-acetyltransferase [Lachnospiraceae bacterium]|nr:GNAT family N-acetyltransferase [Lachnospiraceae bacterium]